MTRDCCVPETAGKTPAGDATRVEATPGAASGRGAEATAEGSPAPGGCCSTTACCTRPQPKSQSSRSFLDGVVETPAGPVPRVRTGLSPSDHAGNVAVRLNIGRDRHQVPPGLYAVGTPAADAPVLVTANYKLTFDHLRSHLTGRHLFILVLDTRGINVWCAAGKGTFGTDELVRRIRETGLARVVTHRRLILPQLGAPGVAAHLVRQATGFGVTYGPVRAADLSAFLEGRLKATAEMRRVHFTLRDRLVVAPVEVVLGAKKAALLAVTVALLSGFGPGGYSSETALARGPFVAALLFAGFLAGTTLGPALLPWLPGRAFAVKGAVLGIGLATAAALVLGFGSVLAFVACAAMLAALSSYLLMNFTGATTFTSLSGVLLEMRYALRAQIAVGLLGIVLWILVPFTSRGAS